MPLTPHYKREGVTIYNCDCSAVNVSVDIVITDPPYGMEFRSNHRAEKWRKIHGDASLPIEGIRSAIALATRAAYIFCRWDSLPDMPNPTSVLAWVKNNWSMGDLQHEHGRQWEAICFYPKMVHEFIKRIPDVLHADRSGNSHHPVEKPVDLIEQLIAANVGNTVFDPYMGSGSTAIASI